jgi:lauroyl/myristoyl acyltransferase
MNAPLERIKVPMTDTLRLAMTSLSMATPTKVAYRLACKQGERDHQRHAWIHQTIPENVAAVLGETLSPADGERIALDYARLRRCEAVDRLQLAASVHRMRRVMELRGAEHLRQALGAGHGALLCTAHYGSYLAAAGRLGAEGFPVSLIREPFQEETTKAGLGEIERRRRKMLARRYLDRYLKKTIFTGDGQFDTGVQIARRLRQNEAVISFLDPPPPEEDRARAVATPFLSHTARLLAGSIMIAQRLGTPVLMMLTSRAPDYAHSTLEISAPITPEATPAATLARCLAVIEDAIRARPAEWFYWPKTDTLQELDLLPISSAPASAAEQSPPTAPIST